MIVRKCNMCGKDLDVFDQQENISYHSTDKTDYRTIPETVEISCQNNENKCDIGSLSQKTECFRERYLQGSQQNNIDRINDYLSDPGICSVTDDTH